MPVRFVLFRYRLAGAAEPGGKILQPGQAIGNTFRPQLT
jgi:hypothetical protein